VDGGGGKSDVITIRSARGTTLGMAGVAMSISSVSGNVVNVTNNMACNVGDTAIMSNGSSCDMKQVTAMSAPFHNGITLNAAPSVNSGDIACTGVWSEITYAVSTATNHDLQTTVVTASDATVATPATVVADIVNIQAQYGIAATEDSNVIASWVNATGAWAAQTPANNKLIRAVRIAVVARNGAVHEKTAVTSTCSSLTDASPTGLCAWAGTPANPAPEIDLSVNADGTANPDFDHYRYRVYETIIPIRNVLNAN
jgi:type IV pilus assembly protein PilW